MLPGSPGARIDAVGLVDELVRQYRAPLADALRGYMRPGDRLAGDLFGAQLVGGQALEVDPALWVEAYEAGWMTREQYVSALRVGATRAREILGEAQLAAVAEPKPTTPALRVTRLPRVQVDLVDAARRLAAAVDPSRS